jgi:hypothetical protein
VAWQIDPFGNSAVSPALFSQLGYESIILSRIGTTVYSELEKTKSAEFIWSGVSAYPEEAQLFAHPLENSMYNNPIEFQYDGRDFMFWDHPKVTCSHATLGEPDKQKECMEFFMESVI